MEAFIRLRTGSWFRKLWQTNDVYIRTKAVVAEGRKRITSI